MFWDNSSVNTTNALLDSENVTLEQVLSDGSCFEEFLGKSAKLIEFLQKNFSKMLDYITQNPYENLSDERAKYAFIVAEILSSDNWAFTTNFCEGDQYFKQLWSIVSNKSSDYEQKNKIDNQTDSSNNEIDTKITNLDSNLTSYNSFIGLNPIIASYFTRIFSNLFQRHTSKMLSYMWELKAPDDFVSCILRHLNISSIMDLISVSWEFLMTGSERNIENINKFTQILVDNQFIERCIVYFIDPAQEEKQENVLHIFTKFLQDGRDSMITNHQSNSIIEKFESEQFSQSLIEAIFTCRSKYAFKNGFRILQAVARKGLRKDRSSIHSSSSITEQMDEQKDDSDDVKPFDFENSFAEDFSHPYVSKPSSVLALHFFRIGESVSRAVCSRFDDFINLLDDSSFMASFTNTAGYISEPLGVVRIEIIHTFASLSAISHPLFLEKLIQHNVMKIIMDLFFKYQSNSILHQCCLQIAYFIYRNYVSIQMVLDETKEKLEADPSSQERKDDVERLLNWCGLFKQIQRQLINDTPLVSVIIADYKFQDIPSFTLNFSPTNSEVKSFTVTDNNKQQGTMVEPMEQESENVDIEKTAIANEHNNINTTDVEMKNVSEKKIYVPKVKPKALPPYTSYLRHLSNVIQGPLSESAILLRENSQWHEFVENKLSKLNQICETKLPKISMLKNEDIITMFEKETFHKMIPPMPSPIPDVPVHEFSKIPIFEKNPLDDFDFDDMGEETGKLDDFEKVFTERCSSLFDSEEEEFASEKAYSINYDSRSLKEQFSDENMFSKSSDLFESPVKPTRSGLSRDIWANETAEGSNFNWVADFVTASTSKVKDLKDSFVVSGYDENIDENTETNKEEILGTEALLSKSEGKD